MLELLKPGPTRFCARGEKEGHSAAFVEAVDVPRTIKGVIIVRMVIEHNK